MKQLIQNLKNITNGLNNLSEKDALEYEDVDVDGMPASERVQELEEIAEELAALVSDNKFDDDDDDAYHPFLSCAEELAAKVGLDDITVCPYKGQIHNLWLDSNFMWFLQDDGHNSLTIDVYNTQDMPKDEVREFILTELYNFKRDAEWVVDGIYEEEMKKFTE